MPIKDPVRRRELALASYHRQHEKRKAQALLEGSLIHCPRCNQVRKPDHRCVADYARFSEKNKNSGITLICSECQSLFETRIPLPLISRVRLCPSCRIPRTLDRLRERLLRRKDISSGPRLRRMRQPKPLTDPKPRKGSRQTLLPVLELWPYGATGWPIDHVNNIVPRELPDTLRADICQELCLMLLSNQDTDLSPQVVKSVTRRAYGDYARSLDWRDSDGFALADQLGYEHWI